MIELTALSSDDWQLWRSLRLRALEEAPHAFGSRLADWKDAEEARWRQRLEIPGAVHFIARSDGRAVGMASGIPTERTDAAELISMWVAPEARGRGVGDALVLAVVRWARARGARELHLGVVAANRHAIALYARHGFADRGTAHAVCERSMVKPLDRATDPPLGAQTER